MLLRPGLNTAFRSFSTTVCRPANFISNIGKQPIKIPDNVTVERTPTGVAVSGPLGSTSVPFPTFVKLDFDESQALMVSVEDLTNKTQRSIWGRTRTLISHAIIGMTDGFTTPMYLVGVGYRAALEDDPMGERPGWTGKRLNMKLGFSHPVYVPIPDHIKIEVVSPTKILATCTNKQVLGLFTSSVRKHRPPEPYKGKVRSPCFMRHRLLKARLRTRVLLSGRRGLKSKMLERSRHDASLSLHLCFSTIVISSSSQPCCPSIYR
ncbi:uncharacterized protein PHACADRAFT_261652 [Phanerochaete carnosa HHB-10118-sp]|uniref:Large ribosomal subunit protein uL6 alpha-beta domain-containing protein n=1 Tax=Phanerochaete carnosa (strain HHB-10118-sp) TaxID=650164 RepID=K5UP05_PHACS|nr:uncharacterized protein PHACADRAFT_261652 [Phanerochaete carnosa HHB-10118-sp]EKM51491.1 hypothetical protein PHACADRAFT_261652 [Phanerochaete carnosa HHB-10118-sp]